MEPFRDRFPGRFINVGVAEQNLIGLATGLAEAGFRPYAYSIATFAALRRWQNHCLLSRCARFVTRMDKAACRGDCVLSGAP